MKQCTITYEDGTVETQEFETLTALAHYVESQFRAKGVHVKIEWGREVEKANLAPS